MCTVESERDPSGCRASGLTPELPVHVVLVPPLLVPSLLVPPLLRFSGAGADGATSTASRLLFSGWQ